MRRSAQTKRTRRPWSSDQHLLIFLYLSVCPSVFPTTKMRKKQRENMSPGRPGGRGVIDASRHSHLRQSQLSSTPLSFILTITPEEKGWRGGGGEGGVVVL